MSAYAGPSRRAVLGGLTGALGLGTLATLSGCSAGKPETIPSDDAAEAAVTVRVIDNAYEPADVEVSSGEAVRWVFDGPTEHDVVAEDGSFVSELITGGEYIHVFDEAGEYHYDCSIHPEMTGVVRVA